LFGNVFMYLKRIIFRIFCARVLPFVSGAGNASPSPKTNGQWSVIRPSPLSVCLPVCLSVQLFRVHCMSVSWQLHSQCAAALLILFQLCACECLVSLMGTFDFHFSYCNYSLYTQIQHNTHHRTDRPEIL